MTRRFLVGLATIALLLTAPLLAQTPTSTLQMQLVNSSVFTNRVQYLMVQQARTVMLESASDATHNGSDTGANATDLNYNAACHTLRATYAKTVIQFPPEYSAKASVLIVSGNFADAVIVGATISGSGSTADTAATDTALLNAIKHNWSTFSGCVTNP